MEFAHDYTPLRSDAASAARLERGDAATSSPEAVVLQVDATVSNIHGLAWLMERRDAGILARLSELQAEAKEAGWSLAELSRARLSLLKPRRAEINALGQAYLGSMLPGAVDAVRRLRRAGISVAIASEVAHEALFGVANALGLGTAEIIAPRLRFDTLGAYVGCDVSALVAASASDESDLRSTIAHTVFVGTRPSELLAPTERDSFVAFTGVVAREGLPPAQRSVDNFADLALLLVP